VAAVVRRQLHSFKLLWKSFNGAAAPYDAEVSQRKFGPRGTREPGQKPRSRGDPL